MSANAEKKATVGNIKAFYDRLKQIFMEKESYQSLRKNMGLGDTLGPLEEQYGGTGSADLNEVSKLIQYVEFEEMDTTYAGKPIVSAYLPGVVTIAESAFDACPSLRKVHAPDVIEIGSGAFSDCEALVEIGFENAVAIGTSAFSGCSALGSISIPGGSDIGESAFANLNGLTNIVVGEEGKVTTISTTNGYTNSGAFWGRSCQGSAPYYANLRGAIKIVGDCFLGLGGQDVVGAIDLTGCTSLTGGQLINDNWSISSYGTVYVWVPATVTEITANIITKNTYTGSNAYNYLNIYVYCEAASQPSSWPGKISSTATVSYGKTYAQFKAAAGI